MRSGSAPAPSVSLLTVWLFLIYLEFFLSTLASILLMKGATNKMDHYNIANPNTYHLSCPTARVAIALKTMIRRFMKAA